MRHLEKTHRASDPEMGTEKGMRANSKVLNEGEKKIHNLGQNAKKWNNAKIGVGKFGLVDILINFQIVLWEEAQHTLILMIGLKNRLDREQQAIFGLL